jgi:hypothetical protein
MARYCVNATVTMDAWTHIEADDLEEAREQASTLTPREFETGDPFDHDIVSVELDA